MRIIHVDSAATWRGGQNQVLLTAQGMSRAGHAVAVACQAGGVLEQRAQEAGLDRVPLPFSGDLSPRAVLGLIRLFERHAPDVVQAHDPHAVSAAALAALIRRPPRLVATRRVDFPLRHGLSRWKYRRCDRVVAVSRAIARVLERDGLPAERLRLVYEGVPARVPQPGGAEALRALGVPAGAAVVGNVAALTDHKDHATLVDAAALVLKRVEDVRFVVLGEGELRSAIERRVRERALEGRFILGGFRRDLDTLLPAFDVFCLSSHMEGLGTSLLDAMMFGLPIVATEAGGIPEAVLDGVSGRVVPPRRPDLLAEALLAVLRDTVARSALAEGARRRFDELFRVERMVAQTLAVYREPL